MCVDDEIAGTEIRGEILEEEGYSVVLHHSPFETLRSDLSAFDLGILDFQMPGLNGTDLAVRMRTSGAQFPILLLTGCLDALPQEDRGLFARCLDKAMPIQRLLDAIEEILNPSCASITSCKDRVGNDPLI